MRLASRMRRSPVMEVPGGDDLPPPPEAASGDEAWGASGDKTGSWVLVLSLVAAGLAVFQIFTGLVGPLPGISHRAAHVGLALAVVFLALPVTGRRGLVWPRRLLAVGATGAAVITAGYVILSYDQAVTDPRFGYGASQVALGILLLALLLYASYRQVGVIVPVLVLLGLAYPFVSEYLPDVWGAPALRLDTVIHHLYLTAEGVFGTITGVSSREIAAFIIFGGFLMASGAGEFFLGLSRLVGARLRGGSAYVALLASTFFGMINGSATANATSTGVMTIPMMKRQKYPAPFAAAVEAVASTGGQITPPVMGATAFVMAELTGVSYATIAIAALVPAAAFLLCVAAGIFFHARRFEISTSKVIGEQAKTLEFVNLRNVIEFTVPVAILVYLLFAGGRSPAFAATIALISLLVIDFVVHMISGKGALRWTRGLLKTLVVTGKGVAQIGVLVATVQILASMLTYAGLASRISLQLVAAASGGFFLTLLLAMLVCTVLGMELPAVGAYVLGAAVVAPALIALDVSVIAAHMFVLFFSILAAITPPVCTTVFVTASMASTSWIRTARYAVVLGLAAWLIPFVIVYEPGILLGTELPTAWFAIGSLLLGIVLIAAGGAGWFMRRVGWPVRCLLFALGLLSVAPISWVSALTLAVAVLLALLMKTWVPRSWLARERPGPERNLAISAAKPARDVQ